MNLLWTKLKLSTHWYPSIGVHWIESVLDASQYGGFEAMRDIREDLRERLATIQMAYNQATAEFDEAMVALQIGYRQKADALERERVAVLRLLEIEEARPETAKDQSRAAPTDRPPVFPMAEFIITKLHAHGPMTKEEIRTHVDLAGYLDGEATGRTFHLTLMNISNSGGRVKKFPDGRYAFRPNVTQAPLFGAAQTAMPGTSRTIM